MIMKLISMVDFVLQQEAERKDDELFKEGFYSDLNARLLSNGYKYANFLNQPLTLGMFVPCDEEGNAMNKPMHIFSDHPSEEHSVMFQGAMNRYQQAKERVLFSNDFTDSQMESIKRRIDRGNRIEYFCQFDELTLTQTAVKQIGL
jgi:hypothetical protein